MKICSTTLAPVLLTTAFLLLMPILGSAQPSCVILDKTQPPQYLSFDRSEVSSKVPKGDDPNRVWLRFHNNTSCPLVLISEMEPATRQMQIIKQPTGGVRIQRTIEPPEVPASGTPIELAYQTQDKRMRRAPLNATSKHYVFSVRLLPERYITFNVPLNYFRQGLHIVVPFNYDWELDANGIMRGGFRVFHKAKFFNEELPANLLADKR